MGSFLQCFRSKAPVPVNTRNCGAQYGITVINCDRGTRFRRATQGWRIIIRYATAVQRARVFSCIISYLQIANRVHYSVYRQLKRRRTFTDVPGFVRYRSTQAVGAFVQTIWREAPASILAGNHCAQHCVAVIDRHRGSRFRRAVQSGRRIVGQIPTLQLAGVLCNIVSYLRNAGSGRSGIYRQLKRRRTLADVAGFVRHRRAQAMRPLAQLR
ncbi:hypothetical protein SB6410_00905 [Klebsiella pasteurii]|uniref:Uncharacterized protein n=1 Tax=Klebsiella pasteurii TaxID=2587529 RepID=A0A9Q9S426_9ENTR|nr:hypothetical protein SB6410_00905 [Klebsiella pasteurii]